MDKKSSKTSVREVGEDENDHYSSTDEKISDSDSSSISTTSKGTRTDWSSRSSLKSQKKSDRSHKSSSRSKVEHEDSRSSVRSNADRHDDRTSAVDSNMEHDDDGMSSIRSRRSKLCPKRRTCCSVCLCILKFTIIVTIFLVLGLIGVGFFLTKLEFDCKLKDLRPKLYSDIYGQDVAIKRTLESVNNFCTGLSLSDPLTLVFWGPTGVGKTFFTTIFTDHFDSKGHVLPSEHFKAAKYKDWYGNQDKNRPFVYAVDDVMTLDDMQNIATNVEKFSHPLIFIITTSMESNLLNQSFIDWCADGKAEMDYIYTGQDPTWLVELERLNPVLVPFLPLSRTNVKLCVEKTLKTLKMKYEKNDIEKIANEFEYFSNDKRLFSKIGCKRANDKIFSVLSP